VRVYNSTMVDPEAAARALADTLALVRAESEHLRLIARRTVEESIRVGHRPTISGGALFSITGQSQTETQPRLEDVVAGRPRTGGRGDG
jgi:hypothetical protein